MLLHSIENFLSRHGISASQFGRDAAQDPRLVKDLRAGRALRPPLDQRVRGFMEGFELGRSPPRASRPAPLASTLGHGRGNRDAH